MSQKVENILNLALEATPEERARSGELDVGYDTEEREWELIVKYSGSLDAARIDGANQLQLIRYIITPAAKPAVVTLFVLTFTESWNMVEQPMIFLEREQDYPLSVFLAAVSQGDIGIQSVCGLLCLVPVTFFFLYYREELTDGLKDVLWG